MAKSAYLPTLSATLQELKDRSSTDVKSYPIFNSDQTATQQQISLSLSWVLYDFGGRSAALKNATELLAAAQANQDAALQETFMNAAKDFYAAQAAYGTLAVANEIVQFAKESYDAASGRADKGIAPITDQLQTQTSYVQAIVDRTKAEEDSKNAIGTLMSDLDLSPDVPISLAKVDESVSEIPDFTKSLSALIQEAMQMHPSVREAQAELDASRAKIDQTRAQGMPTVSLTGKYNRDNQPISPSLGEPGLPAIANDRYIGVQISIPLFEGFNRTYEIRQAQAQTEVAEADLEKARQKVGVDVWTSANTLYAATENITNTAMLVDIAQHSFDAAFHRYQVGVGSVIELLNAQSALANAKKQRIQALTDWRTARLQLAKALGRIGMWSLAQH